MRILDQNDPIAKTQNNNCCKTSTLSLRLSSPSQYHSPLQRKKYYSQNKTAFISLCKLNFTITTTQSYSAAISICHTAQRVKITAKLAKLLNCQKRARRDDKPEPRLYFLSTNIAPFVITAHGNHQPTSLLSITRSTVARGYLITNPLVFLRFSYSKRDKQTRVSTTTADKLWLLARQARLYSDRLLWLLCLPVPVLNNVFVPWSLWSVLGDGITCLVLSATGAGEGRSEGGRRSRRGRNVTAAGSGYPTTVEPNLLLFFCCSATQNQLLNHNNLFRMNEESTHFFGGWYYE